MSLLLLHSILTPHIILRLDSIPHPSHRQLAEQQSEPLHFNQSKKLSIVFFQKHKTLNSTSYINTYSLKSLDPTKFIKPDQKEQEKKGNHIRAAHPPSQQMKDLHNILHGELDR